ncbi:zinc ribbon domain-containing protein [Acuticoccus sp. I52.16.1]|uniref:zinc ribbon domain-containing protein n=1 Tax=Acuticoccus sp. I52.16.1 TaxID=2928472 RepID=UPI001FD4FC9A|nr:zinc ribbon domain-containing protein [Acuticoccus sp. I52.16.1]UOM36025.1 zinc ribbon domain-containing protein [Acuticoccus sp. I52.16.1]
MRRLFRIETLFALGKWAVSLALAFFLTSLGSLIIADLPQVERPPRVEEFVDAEAAARLDAELSALGERIEALSTAAETGQLNLEAAEADSAAERETFAAWIQARRATGDGVPEEDVVVRTRRLEEVRRTERQVRADLDAARGALREAQERTGDVTRDRAALLTAAEAPYQRALFLRQARVFGLRLALTLPLLVVGLWAVAKRRNSPRWPLWRGFVLFAAFAFFVELVPYLPSYGGYIHYGVGVVMTLVLGAWLVRAARRHRERRAEIVERSEAERRQAIHYDEAVVKAEKGTCPSCDNTLRTTDGAPVNFCIHCGLKLYEPCPQCGTRRLVFFPFCMSCGTHVGPEEARAAISDARK